LNANSLTTNQHSIESKSNSSPAFPESPSSGTSQGYTGCHEENKRAPYWHQG